MHLYMHIVQLYQEIFAARFAAAFMSPIPFAQLSQNAMAP